MSEKIKPVRCGCGGEARIGKIYGDAWTVECTECGIQSGSCDTEEEAIEAWNKAMGATDNNVGSKKGEWLEKFVSETKGNVAELQSAKCSACGKYHTTPYMYYFDNFNYCPNCGAIMETK